MPSSSNPYSALGPKHFWRTSVAQNTGFYDQIHAAKFKIGPNQRLVSFGSCFAQHVSRALAASGFNWTDFEPAPPFLSSEVARRYGYGIYSARVENIYTLAALRQWLCWAFEPDQADMSYWTGEGNRVLDPLRPFVEPDGFATEDEFLTARHRTFAALRDSVRQADVFIFTLGQTEAWLHKDRGLVYALCPGTQAGSFDPDQHIFENFSFQKNRDDLEAVLDLLRRENPSIQVILTVSPVPLVATAVPDSHAIVSNTYTKSVLRAVAGEAAAQHDNVDYFPSYELICQGPNLAKFFEPNLRSVTPEGVEFVMAHFFQAYTDGHVPDHNVSVTPTDAHSQDVVCAEMILDVYNEF